MDLRQTFDGAKGANHLAYEADCRFAFLPSVQQQASRPEFGSGVVH